MGGRAEIGVSVYITIFLCVWRYIMLPSAIKIRWGLREIKWDVKTQKKNMEVVFMLDDFLGISTNIQVGDTQCSRITNPKTQCLITIMIIRLCPLFTKTFNFANF